jgi:hypothetical protein
VFFISKEERLGQAKKAPDKGKMLIGHKGSTAVEYPWLPGGCWQNWPGAAQASKKGAAKLRIGNHILLDSQGLGRKVQ